MSTATKISPPRTVEATVDVCSAHGQHEPHLRLSIPWPDSTLKQHWLWCLGGYDQDRQGHHVQIRTSDFETGEIVEEVACGFGCTSVAHAKRRTERA